MDHGGLSALPCQSVHVAGSHRDPGPLLGLSADPFHVGAKEGVHTGNADHDHRGLLVKALADGLHRRRDPLEVSACHQVRFVHEQVKEAVLIARQGGNGGGVASAAAGGDDQHDRARNGQARPLDAKALGPRRVEGQGGRRRIDQVAPRHQMGRDLVLSPLPELGDCIGYCFRTECIVFQIIFLLCMA